MSESFEVYGISVSFWIASGFVLRTEYNRRMLLEGSWMCSHNLVWI